MAFTRHETGCGRVTAYRGRLVAQAGSAAAATQRPPQRSALAQRGCIVVCGALVAVAAVNFRAVAPRPAGAHWQSHGLVEREQPLAFLAIDEKDGRKCGREGDVCRCFGKVRYGRFVRWSDEKLVDGSINCTAANFGVLMPSALDICKCYPTICTTDVGTCTAEPCGCPLSRDPEVEWAKKTLMTSDGTKCWACEKRAASLGVLVKEASPFCPTQPGRCSAQRACKCESALDTKRVMRTKDGVKCWTCAPVAESGTLGMDSGQKAMFWMLPMLWPFMDFPNSVWEVCNGCRALTSFLALCVVGYILQTFVPVLRLDRFLSFYAPCMKKGEFWRLFTYFMLHSDLQHLCINLFHLLDTLDLEGVPDLEVSPGVSLRCTRDGPISSVCYPDVGIGLEHTVALFAVVLAYGALVGTIRNFGALVQGASSVCFGVDGALIALYAMFLGAGLDSQLRAPEFGAFFWTRIGIIGFHIIIDIIQSICGGGKDTVGTMAHMASLAAGFCYVILMLPPMGDGSLFDSDQPYIISCGMTSPSYVTMQEALLPCVAFFKRSNGMQVQTAQRVAVFVLGSGVLASVVNAVLKRDISDDGIACCSCGDVPGQAPQRPPQGTQPQAREEGQASAVEQELAGLRAHIALLRENQSQLQGFYDCIPDPDTLRFADLAAASASQAVPPTTAA